MGHIFWKLNEHSDHTYSATGHEIPELETFSRILQKSGNENDEFLWDLIVSNLVCIKTYYSFKPTKTLFNDQKHKS